MASTNEERAALVYGPTAQTEAAGPNGTYRYTIDGSAQNALLPAAMIGKWIDLYASVEVQWAFGEGTAPSLVFNQDAATGSGSAASGKDLPAGTIYPTRVPSKATHIGWRAAGAGGKFAFNISERPG